MLKRKGGVKEIWVAEVHPVFPCLVIKGDQPFSCFPSTFTSWMCVCASIRWELAAKLPLGHLQKSIPVLEEKGNIALFDQ